MATAGTRTDLFIGPVRCVELDDEEDGTRTISTSYELNVIDGWVRKREWFDEATMSGAHAPTRKSSVKEVLEAAPDCTAFIVDATLVWIKALLQAEGLGRKAGAQRRALEDALHDQGLALTAEVKQELADLSADARRIRAESR